jgi:endo-1,4-beta-xylanase
MRLLIISAGLFLFSFINKEDPKCVQKTLREACPFPIGVAINTDKLKYEEKYWQLVPQFNSITAEKVMKPQYLHPEKDKYYFEETDNLIAFCKEFKIRLHGHTLVWHNANPKWMENYNGTREEWDAILKDHVQTIIKHCKHYVKSWDVVNEAFNNDGSLRKNIWLKNIGEEYIEKSYLYAQEADPEAILFYNDFSLEQYGQKFRAVVNYFEKLKAKGIKIDGIGMQMHITSELPYISEINQATIHLQEKDFLVHYSELDVSLATGSLFATKKGKLQRQRERYKSIMEVFSQLKKEYQFGITLWGVSDNDSWLMERSSRTKPLLYDQNYKPKPAICGFLEGIKKH